MSGSRSLIHPHSKGERIGWPLFFLLRNYDNSWMSEDGNINESDAKKEQRPSCGNCGKPAIVYLGSYPACIDCKYKHDISQWMQFAQNAAMLNYAAQEMDAIVGFGPLSPTIQIPRPPVPPINYNNQTVSVSGGNVGAINFGNVHEIQVNLQSLTETESIDLVEPLAKLTDSILNARDADEQTKNDLLEQIATLTTLANSKPEGRKPGVIKALLSAIKDGAGAISSVAGAWTTVEPLLEGHFGL